MAEYIEREALKQYLLGKGFYPAIVKGALESLPSADVVEVVRCKDCKYSFVGRGGELKCDALYPSLSWVENDDFCSWGKRKDGAE